MEVPLKQKRKNPFNKANPVSKLIFAWTFSLFKKGKEGTLTLDDLYDVPKEEEAKRNADRLQKNWEDYLKKNDAVEQNRSAEQEKLMQNGNGKKIIKMEFLRNGNKVPDLTIQTGRKNSSKEPEEEYKHLLKALLATFGKEYFSVWPFMILTDCALRVMQPWFLLLFVRSFFEERIDHQAQYLFGTGVVLSTLAITLTYNPSLFYLGRVGQRCRVALSSLIQRKMMRLSQRNLKTDEGQVVTLVSKDASCIESNILMIPYLLIGPVQLSLFMYFLFQEFGVYSFAGVGFILAYMPFQYWNGSMSTQYRLAISKETDERTRLLAEIISGMNTIKMYAWENVFKGIVNEKRKSEVKQIRKRSVLHAFQMSIFLTSSRLVPFLTFLTFVLGRGSLTAERVFYALAAYNIATHYMVFLVPGAIRGLGEIRGSLKRIQKFLSLEEKTKAKYYEHTEATLSSNTNPHMSQIQLTSANALWTCEAGLSNINLNIAGDKLVLVIGGVGSGKSSLLQLILGELPLNEGSCKIQGKISYAPQVPWIFNGSIKHNIVFTEEWNESKYLDVIKAASLEKDLYKLPQRDLTPVGDRGCALSGGQRSRVNLARALYRDAEIYLLDDPLSAVDTKVSQELFQTFKNKLSRKLRILVTNQHQYLPQADYIVVFRQGIISCKGTYSELKARNIPEIQENCREGGADVDCLVTEDLNALQKNLEEMALEGNDNGEEKSEGTIGFKIYWKYFKAGDAYGQFTFILMTFIISQVFITFIEYWIALWANAEEKALKNSSSKLLSSQISPNINESKSERHFETIDNPTDIQQNSYLFVYTILTGAVFCTNLVKATGFFSYSIKICTNIHLKMLSSLVRAKPEFFNLNPSGRVINRLSKDVEIIDERIPFAFFDLLTIFLQIGTVIFLLVLANWYTIFAVVAFLVALRFVRRYYVATSRDLKRLEAITRSPICTHLTSTFCGLTTIRAMGAENRMSNQFDSVQDINTASTFLFGAAKKCFDMWVESIAVILLGVVTFGFLIAQNYFGMEFLGGNVGLAICSAMSLTNWLNYGMVISAEVENCMVSVERTLEYTKLESEAELESSPEKRPQEDWPKDGKLSFDKVILQYKKDGPTVLNNLTFDIKSGEKVGIVGRTGVGKSSILWALFRMTEPNGTIGIDSVPDLRQIGLHDLRKNLSIIPQEPVLFRNTLRFNLDPELLTSDLEMNKALKLVELDKTLEFEISDGGSNLSVGQRQLVSLARALIRKTRIVAMDEATANIDPKTDGLIQKTLKELLDKCTVLTIAHRLETVIESDRILVMDCGQLVEFDAPHRLLQNENSALLAMVENNPPEISEYLKTKAALAYHTRNNV